MITCNEARKELCENRKLSIDMSIDTLLTILDKEIKLAVSLGEVSCHWYKHVGSYVGVVAKEVANILRERGYVVRYSIKDDYSCSFTVYIVEPTIKNKIFSFLNFWLGVDCECLFARGMAKE